MATRSWNRVELIGNLTRDPELRYTPQGSAVVSFSIATNRTFTASDGEKKEEADFHRIIAWNKLAELCSQLLKKGNRVFVSGRLQNRSWEGQDGQTRNTTEIVIEDMILLTSRGDSDYSSSSGGASTPEPVASRQVDEMPKKETKKEEIVREKVEEPKAKEELPAKEEVEDLDDLPF